MMWCTPRPLSGIRLIWNFLHRPILKSMGNGHWGEVRKPRQRGVGRCYSLKLPCSKRKRVGNQSVLLRRFFPPTEVASTGCSYNPLRRFSNHSRISAWVIMPRPIRITAIMAIQMKRRSALLIMAIRSNIPSIAAIIKNIGELVNSGIINVIPLFNLLRFELNPPFPSLLRLWQQRFPHRSHQRTGKGYMTSTQQSVRHRWCAGNNRLWR